MIPGRDRAGERREDGEMGRKPSEKWKNEDFRKRPLVVGRDFGELLGIILLLPISWLFPARAWRFFSFSIAILSRLGSIKGTLARLRNLRRILEAGQRLPEPGRIEIFRSINIIEQKIQYLRELRPGGWKPDVRVHGLTSIERALQGGNGAILWITPFFFSNLVLKKGLHEAGFPLCHLSAYNHGPSLSRFGIRFVNRIYIKAENKYLKERIRIEPGRSLIYKRAGTNLAYVRKMEERLSGNCLISIGCQPDRGLDHSGNLKDFLGGKLPVATGAPALALSTGSPLIPVFTIRRAMNRFDILIMDPLEVPNGGKRREKIDRLLDRFMEITESRVLENPFLFSSWHEVLRDESISPGESS